MLQLVALAAYLGGAIGQSQVNLDPPPIPGYSITVDETGDTFKLVGGLQVNPNLAIEANLYDLGEFSPADTAEHSQ